MNDIEYFMNYVRRDGPETAPICFLTIEDGGELWKRDKGEIKTYSELVEFYKNKEEEIWERKIGQNEELGQPGIWISKIMATLIDGSLKKWADYRGNRIYLENECNIKFYPIGRQTQNTWDNKIENGLGLKHWEYMELCNSLRPASISKHPKMKKAFTGENFHIILGAKNEWVSFLKKFVYGESIRVVPFEHRDLKSTQFEKYYINGKLEFCYAKMFGRGITNVAIEDFFCKVRKELDGNVKRKLQW
ncbi:MAG: hypothetical protein C0623_04715 [Desulfuromonas sp.]|nr:MAG: hypothetical protein C0623_04715 [Desulfuromonas sp.]